MKRYAKAHVLDRLFHSVIHNAETLEGTAFRAVGTEYANKRDLLSGEGTSRSGGRWTPRRSFATVHASLDVKTALAEFLGTQQRYGISVAGRLPLTLVAVDFRLRAILNLTDDGLLTELGLTKRRLCRCRWQESMDGGREALTQALGRLAFEQELEGLLVPSARARKGRNIIVFPRNLRKGSSLAIQNVEKLRPADD